MTATTSPPPHHRFGATPVEHGNTRFQIWSPGAQRVELLLTESAQTLALEKQADGFWSTIQAAPAGTKYQYRVDGSMPIPDPASRCQAESVHGPSVVVDPAFDWTDARWRGVDRDNLIVYELHIGCFTDAGTFVAAIDRLDELIDLGITAIELMPVADAAGRWNWGYDGVHLFAPNRNYGSPADLRRLVDAAHARGLAVILDVVYNHLGPEGNYLALAGPYLSTKHQTGWGAGPNFDDGDAKIAAGVRQFFCANAIHWFDDYHIDGLRVDAIHCMKDESPRHIVAELSESVGQWKRASGRPALLIAESNVYDDQMLTPLAGGGMGFDAEWCDDFLHSTFACLRPGEMLSDRRYETGTDLDRVLRQGFVYHGTLWTSRERVDDADRVDSDGLIYSIQNHDFIGNHPTGKRLHQIVTPDQQRAAAALLMLCPAIPMLFMGEEFACEHPFHFFVDFGDENLRRGVVEGRRREYPQHDWDGGVLPTDPAAFHESKIGPIDHGNAETRVWYQQLIAIRKRWQREGRLTDGNLTVASDPAAGQFTLRYVDAEVAVDLSRGITRIIDGASRFASGPVERRVSRTRE